MNLHATALEMPLSRVAILGMGAMSVLVGVVGWAAFRTDSSSKTTIQREVISPTADLTQPTPELTPIDVVRLQLASLNGARDDELGVRQCFAFASPLNRQATGPFMRFRAMFLGPPYDVMLEQHTSLVGKAVVRGERAAVLVTIISADRHVHVFRFYLSLQTESPYEKCWMTDSVIKEGAAQPVPRAPSNPPVDA